MFDVFNKIIIQDKKIPRHEMDFDHTVSIKKMAQNFAILGYTFIVQTVFKTKKQNNFEYFDQAILMQRKYSKLINC